MVEITLDIPEWLYRYFIGMYNFYSVLSEKTETLEVFITYSVSSMVKDFDPEGLEEAQRRNGKD